MCRAHQCDPSSSSILSGLPSEIGDCHRAQVQLTAFCKNARGSVLASPRDLELGDNVRVRRTNKLQTSQGNSNTRKLNERLRRHAQGHRPTERNLRGVADMSAKHLAYAPFLLEHHQVSFHVKKSTLMGPIVCKHPFRTYKRHWGLPPRTSSTDSALQKCVCGSVLGIPSGSRPG